MTARVCNAVCLAVDGLRASALGAYGNTWFDTPALDQFASRAQTVDFTFCDARGIESAYRSLWRAAHGLRPAPVSSTGPHFIQQCVDRGYRTRLVTDDPTIATLPPATAFDQVVQVRRPRSVSTVHRVDQTQVARVMGEAVAQIEDLAAGQEPFLLWVHSHGMTAPWDAPLDLRQQLADSEDPEPDDRAEVPCLVLDADDDPDRLFALACGYAAQIIALDASVGALCRHVDQLDARETTVLTLIGTAGFPLGEHTVVGAAADCLYSESLHVPWLIRIPGRADAIGRSSALAHLADFPATLAGVLHGDATFGAGDGRGLSMGPPDSLDPGRDHLCVADTAGGLGLRTHDWYYLREASMPPRLFVKPDDQWEVNDISDRCPDVVDALDRTLQAEVRRLARAPS